VRVLLVLYYIMLYCINTILYCIIYIVLYEITVHVIVLNCIVYIYYIYNIYIYHTEDHKYVYSIVLVLLQHRQHTVPLQQIAFKKRIS
jgi:hypothetical protein